LDLGDFPFGIPGNNRALVYHIKECSFSVVRDNSILSTSSDLFINHSTFTTPEEKEAGLYIFIWSVVFGQSDKQKRVGIQVQTKLNQNVAWITISEINHTVGFDGEAGRETGLALLQIVADDQVDFRTNFGATIDGGIGRVEDNDYSFWRVEDLP